MFEKLLAKPATQTHLQFRSLMSKKSLTLVKIEVLIHVLEYIRLSCLDKSAQMEAMKTPNSNKLASLWDGLARRSETTMIDLGEKLTEIE